MSERQGVVISGVDRAWLEMDAPANPMVVNAVIEFEPPVNEYRLCAEMVERILRHPRFRQRAEMEPAPPRWVDDEAFNVEYHSQVIPPQQFPSDAMLRAAIEAQVSQPLDRTMPLWRLFVYARPDRSATVLFRAHHGLADGIALVQMLMQCLDGAPKKNGAAPAHEPRTRHHGPLGKLIDRLEWVNAMAERVGDFALADLRHPEWIPGQLREARDMATAVTHVLALPEDNPRELCRPLQARRSVAWAGDIPLAPVKRLAHATGAKVNDVFLAAVAGAFNRYLQVHGAALKQTQNLRVSVPVNLRPAGEQGLGNCFGLVLVDLPVGVRDWQQRLELVRQRMEQLKHSPTARVVLFSLAAAGHLPASFEKQLVRRVAAKSAAVVSNLRGPARAMALAGMRIRTLAFWPPAAETIGVGLSLFSFNRHITVGICADRGVVANAQSLLDALREELRAMSGATRRPRKPVARKAALERPAAPA
ncbi:MAG TPA: WS/DGAT domain-containing protein, partial [Nevskiaceae bacterium]|nr:WS/DGAT domain-containing protein [Nevskiaceae bacterium]